MYIYIYIIIDQCSIWIYVYYIFSFEQSLGGGFLDMCLLTPLIRKGGNDRNFDGCIFLKSDQNAKWLGYIGDEILANYIPIPSMYGIFAYLCLIFMVNVGKYTIHGAYGI